MNDMYDLINRLRGRYPIGPDGVYGERDFSDFIPPISLEAADTIEKLAEQTTKRGARMQIMYDLIYQYIEHNYRPPKEELQLMDSWFDEDGVPK